MDRMREQWRMLVLAPVMLSGTLAAAFVIGDLRCTGGTNPWTTSLLGLAISAHMIALGLFISQVRHEQARTGQRWWQTASIKWLGFGAVVGVAPYAAADPIYRLAVGLGFRLSFPTALTLSLVGVILIAHIATVSATNAVLRREELLPWGSRELPDFEAWAQRRLGAWWLPRTVLLMMTCAFVVWLTRRSQGPAALFTLAMMMSLTAMRFVAHARACSRGGPCLDAAIIAHAQRLAQPDFPELKRRNGWINTIAAPLCLAGFAVPVVIMLWLKPYDDHDWRILWLIALAIGMTGLLLLAFVALVTLPKGWPRFIEFWRYCEAAQGMSVRSQLTLLTVLSLLAVVAGAEIAQTAGPRPDGFSAGPMLAR